LRDLLRDGTGKIVDGAAGLAGTHQVKEALPELVELTRKKVVHGADYRAKTSAVRALGQLGDPRAQVPLRDLLAERSFLFHDDLELLKEEARRALDVLAGREE
jgi:HEAT repeat protein